MAALLLAAAPVSAGPEAELWPRWLARQQGSGLAVDHAVWDNFLRRYLWRGADGIMRVRYGQVSPADRKSLEGYLGALAAAPVGKLDRPEQLAFWINLYNALTIRTVLDRYPVASIRDIDVSPGLFNDGPWGKKLIAVEGEPLSLDDIEHRILRPIWRDPRLHYALNCAALGCPDLQPAAFEAAILESQLDAAARAYVNHPRGVRIDGGDLIVSSIYVWYAADFGGDDVSIIAHLRHYADAALDRALAGRQAIDDDSYDWALNDAR
ncbi:MAG: DUF547 domain-containing protein [Dongiaceae bacterium]